MLVLRRILNNCNAVLIILMNGGISLRIRVLELRELTEGKGGSGFAIRHVNLLRVSEAHLATSRVMESLVC